MASKSRFSKDNYTSTIAERIRERMASSRMTRGELANKIGVSEPAISQFQNGHTAPKLDTLIKIAKAFGTTTDYLLGFTNDPNPQHSIIDDTGLSNNSVNTLKSLKRLQERGYYHLSLINSILSYPKLDDVLEDIEAYFASVQAKEIFKDLHSTMITVADKVEYEYSFPELCIYLDQDQDNEIDELTKQYIEEAKRYYETMLAIIHSGRYNKLISHHLLELLDSANPQESKLDYIYAYKALESLKELKDFVCKERMDIIRGTLLSNQELENLNGLTISW